MANIQTAPGFTKAPLDLRNPDPAQLVELQNALKNLGYWNGTIGQPPDLSLIYAVGAFQQTAGYGSADPVISSDQWYGLLYANDQVVNKRPLDLGVWNTLAGARQMGLNSVVDPNTFSASPPGAIGALPGTVPQQGAQAATPAPAPPAAPVVSPAQPNMTDAFGAVDKYLTDNGLGAGSEFDLRQWAHGQMTSPTFSQDVFTTQLQQTPEYKTRFGALNDQRRALGLPSMTPVQTLQYEATVGQIMSASGAPKGFYDTWQELQAPAALGWSPKEIQDRADIATQYVVNLPPEVRQTADAWFGAGSGDQQLWAGVFDPNKSLPLQQHQLAMAEIGGASQRLNIGIDKQQADTLAGMGVTYGGAQQAFSGLDRSRGLFDETVGERQDLTINQTGVDAAFGTAPGAQAELDQRLAARKANVDGGGGATVGSRGVSGLGAYPG